MAWKLFIGGAITGNSIANPTVVTTALAHGMSTGDSAVIAGSNSTPSIDGTRTVTVTGTNTFTVTVNVTVAGTAGTYMVDRRASGQGDFSRGCSISMPLNERATMRFSLLDGFLPPKRADVVAYAQDGSTKLFAGVIVQRQMRSYEGRSLAAFVDCDCGDYSTYADWCYQTKNYPSGATLEDVLDDLVSDKLGAYGISVHGSQVTGPTLSAFEWVDKRVSDCLRELSDRTGYSYRVDADKKLRMFVPGTDAAPFTVTSATPNVENIEWTDSGEVPANTITVRCGPDAVDEVTQTWIQAGGATSWVTDIPAALGQPAPGYVTVNGIFATVGTGAEYEFNVDTSTLSLGTASTPTNGWSIVLVYIAQFPFAVTATTGATPVVEAIYRYPDVKVYEQAVEIAEGLLDRQAQEPRILTMPSTQLGWLPGQAVSVVHSDRDINDTDATISNVDIQLISDDFWRSTLTVQETTAPQASYLQQWRDMLGNGGSSGSASAPSITTVIEGNSNIISGSGHPQGVETATPGVLYRDISTGRIYRKASGSGNTGWYQEPLWGAMYGASGQQVMILQGTLTSSAASIQGWGIGTTGGSVTINGGATLDFGVDSLGKFNSLEKNGNNGGLVGPFGATTGTMAWVNDFDAVWHIKTGSDITNIKYWFGFSTADPSTDTVSGRCILFRYSTNASDGGWVGVTNDNTGQNVSGTVASISDSTFYKLRMRRVGNTIYFSVDDGTETAVTSKVPTDSTQGYFIEYVTGTSGARMFKHYNFGGVIG